MTANERAERLSGRSSCPVSRSRRLSGTWMTPERASSSSARKTTAWLAFLRTATFVARSSAGCPFDEASDSIASRTPVVAPPDVSAMEALRLMNEADVNQLPLVRSADRRLSDLLLRRDLMTEDELSVSAVIMAGGFGTRLRPLTEDTPKPMLPRRRPAAAREDDRAASRRRDPPGERHDALPPRADHGATSATAGVRRGDHLRDRRPAARHRRRPAPRDELATSRFSSSTATS